MHSSNRLRAMCQARKMHSRIIPRMAIWLIGFLRDTSITRVRRILPPPPSLLFDILHNPLPPHFHTDYLTIGSLATELAQLLIPQPTVAHPAHRVDAKSYNFPDLAALNERSNLEPPLLPSDLQLLPSRGQVPGPGWGQLRRLLLRLQQDSNLCHVETNLWSNP